MSKIPERLRRRVRRRARQFCEYCRTHEELAGHGFLIDHVVPRSQGGADEFENLCCCCFWCNAFKQARTRAVDPRTKGSVMLFNPRVDHWDEHFRWSRLALRVIGRTPIGRATVAALQMNRVALVRARRKWARLGFHPPA